MRDAIEHFRAAIHDAGLHPPEPIEADGKLQRFASNGKRSDDAGWYVFHDGGIPAKFLQRRMTDRRGAGK